MKIKDYITLIQNLPVRQQSETIYRRVWEKAENKIKWLSDFNGKFFQKEKSITISRQDIFETTSTRDLILKTIYWGYPRNMRGNHFVNILRDIPTLEAAIDKYKRKLNLTISDYDDLKNTFKEIQGLGLSTYSKILYFLNFKIDGNPCVIFDKRVIDAINRKQFIEYSSLQTISDYNKERNYIPFLTITHKLAMGMNAQSENIEQFLFTYGNNLKPQTQNMTKNCNIGSKNIYLESITKFY